jgi:hypothetical protein
MKSEIDILFENYMKKFNDRYFVRKDEDGIFNITGRWGKIAPYDPEKQLLGCWCINLTRWKKKSFLKRLQPYFIDVHQDCDCEFGGYFHEKDTQTIAKIIGAKKRRALSDEQRQALAKRCAVINTRRKICRKILATRQREY